MIWIIHFLVINILLIIARINKNDNIFIKSTFIYSIFVFGQRWMTGEDFPGYLLYYLINFKTEELGYFLLQSFFVKKELYFGNLIFILYFITLFNTFKIMNKFEKNKIWMFYLYMFGELYFVQMSQIRQFVAISFFINAYYYANKKQIVKLIVNLLLALSFHKSVLLVVPFMFIKLKPSKKNLFFILLFFLFLPLINIKFVFNIGIAKNYSHYLGSVYNTGLSIFHYVRYYMTMLIILIYVYNIKTKLNHDKDSVIITGLIIYLLFYGLSFKFAPVIRISNYFKIYEIIFLSYYMGDIYKYPFTFMRGLIISFILVLYTGIAIMDPYNITRYEFRNLRMYDNKSRIELFNEIENFYIN